MESRNYNKLVNITKNKYTHVYGELVVISEKRKERQYTGEGLFKEVQTAVQKINYKYTSWNIGNTANTS